jgi:glycosyltransferase involved in cell wall biosynthesis
VAISEAIQMGCPVILNDKCRSYGETDDVQEEENGFVYTFGDVFSVAGKIKTLTGDEALKKQFGDHSHQIATSFQQRSHFEMMKDLVKNQEGVEE